MKSDTAYRTISEVSTLLQVPSSALRFWETQFKQLKPLKRQGRRYYQSQDVLLVARIRDLLYKEGLTIKGVIKTLSTQAASSQVSQISLHSSLPQNVLAELKGIRNYLSEYI